VLFLWDAKPSAFRREFLTVRPRLHVAAFMYWWQNKDKLSDIDGFVDAVDGHMARHAGARLVFLTTPWTAAKTFGGVEDRNRLPRNARVAKWVAGSAAADRMHLLDFAAIADAKQFSKTLDGIHYMCIWTPKVPEAVTAQKENGRGCTDPMNYAVAQWLVNLVEAR
jgi:hypothetical protein